MALYTELPSQKFRWCNLASRVIFSKHFMLTPSGGLSRISGETGRPERADRVWVVDIRLEGGFSAESRACSSKREGSTYWIPFADGIFGPMGGDS